MAFVTEIGMTTILSYIIALVSVAACSLFAGFFLYVQQQKWKLNKIPGPKRDSIILGNLTEVNAFIKKGKIAGDVFLMWRKEFGLVFKYSMLHRYLVVALDNVVVKEMLTNSDHVKTRTYDLMGTIFGNRLAATGLVMQRDHAQWKVHRNILNPAFHRKYLMNLIGSFNEEADRFVEHLKKKADGTEEVSMHYAFNNVTLDIIAKVAFGLELNVLDDPDSPFPRAAMTCLNAINQSIFRPWRRYGWSKEDRQFRRDIKEACLLLRRVGQDCIMERLVARSRGEELPRDMLTNILEASEDLKGDKNFGMEEMLDEFVTFFIAGQETTSNLLAFTMELLGKNPDVLKKVQDELDDKLGTQSYISYQDSLKLDYMMLVLKESMRFYPPAAIVSRETGCDVVTSTGMVIPKGIQVNLSTYTMGRMSEYFTDPEVFRPERFKADNESGHPTYSYFPFGLGQRSCIGQQFAFIEARIILAKILRVLKFDLVPGQTWNVSAAVTIRPVDGCKNYISFRE